MTSTTMSWRLQAPPTKKAIHLVNPCYDLIFVCGGLVLLLSAICIGRFGFTAADAEQETVLVALGIFGSYMLSGPHAAATIFRLYGEKQNRQRFKSVSYALPFVLLCGFIFGLYHPLVARVEATLYLLLLCHHFMAQSYGVAMMYCARAEMKLDRKDKLLSKAILYLAVTSAICQQFTPHGQRLSFLQIKLLTPVIFSDYVSTLLQSSLIIIITAFLANQLYKRLNNQSTMPLLAVAALLSGAAFLSLQTTFSSMIWLLAPNFYHASQYLSIVLTRHFKDSKISPSDEMEDSFAIFGKRYARLFIVGFLLFIFMPILIARQGFPLYLCSALAFFSLSLHHFAADACIWKLKDNSLRSRLTA